VKRIYHKTSLELSLPMVLVGGGETSRAGLMSLPRMSQRNTSSLMMNHTLLAVLVGEMGINLARTPPIDRTRSHLDECLYPMLPSSGDLCGKATTCFPSKPPAVLSDQYNVGTGILGYKSDEGQSWPERADLHSTVTSEKYVCYRERLFL